MKLTGDKIRACRKLRNLTQEKLGVVAGTSKRYICELEQGCVKQPSAEKLMAISDELGVSISYLMDDSSIEQTPRHRDEAFYRAYLRLEKPQKEKMHAILNTYIN